MRILITITVDELLYMYPMYVSILISELHPTYLPEKQ